MTGRAITTSESRLQELLRLPYDVVRARRVGLPMHIGQDGWTVECAPFRTRPGCPRPRTTAEKRRHLKRKRSHASRRRNRA